MRLAIILVGHIRTWEKCKQSFINTFSKFNPDIYLYTYDTKTYKSETRLSEEDIRNYFKDINIKKLIIKDENDVLSEVTKKYYNYYIENPNTLRQKLLEGLCQYVNIQNCYNIICNSDIQYDFIIKTRPDIIYNSNFDDIFTEENKNTTNIWTSNCHCSCDFFAASSLIGLNKYCNTINNIEGCYKWCYPHVEISVHMLLHFSIGNCASIINVQKID